ncbi:hypothetical protein [Streptomyces radicis]|uniref:Transmembrane protein n=1 Tax=Streptomyces radicis TaxID=1750517 RepID=A0A3A9WKZ4_9ACTN|nr:hypothetical protein [Streptomyces radicis]RKN06817.1 hypothetical protein D7319_20655 [Streptomyces radicis]RKN19435.1 hypothetical protein D7318_20120 [Streptomyces radicis]
MEAGPRESNGTTEGVPPRRLPDDETLAALTEAAPTPEPEADEIVDVGTLDPVETGEAVEIIDEFNKDESYADLRPPRRLRLSLVAPIALLSLLGSLMFAFPLAFAFDEAGAVVAMLGLLIGCSAAGWGMMAARRVGYTWPGLPPRGSGRRPDWRLLALYGLGFSVLAVLAVLRVAALR